MCPEEIPSTPNTYLLCTDKCSSFDVLADKIKSSFGIFLVFSCKLLSVRINHARRDLLSFYDFVAVVYVDNLYDSECYCVSSFSSWLSCTATLPRGAIREIFEQK